MCGSAEMLAVPNHRKNKKMLSVLSNQDSVRCSRKTTDLQGSFLTGVAGSVGAVPEWRGAGGCCCDIVPLSGDLLTQCQLSLYEEEAPHSHSDLEYKKKNATHYLQSFLPYFLYFTSLAITYYSYNWTGLYSD